jgi:hypothetical protein
MGVNMKNNDFPIFDGVFIYDIPADYIGFFMFGYTGKTFRFSSKDQILPELRKAAEYAKHHDTVFNAEKVYEELMKRQNQ